MRHLLLGMVVAATSVFSANINAKGEFLVRVIALDSNHYGVVLENSYSHYYNEKIAGRFESAKQAYDAGIVAREKLLSSGVHDEPEHCWYDVDWL